MRLQIDYPLSVGHHPEFPEVDVSYVKDAHGNELCTCYGDASHVMARVIKDALESVKPREAISSPAQGLEK